MNPKHLIPTLLLALLLPQGTKAQELFNEITYSPKATVFQLNAPVKPTLRLYEAGRGGKAYKKISLVGGLLLTNTP